MIVSCENRIIADDITVVDSFFTKLLGLMGKKEISENQGMLLKNCSSIHCFFMRMTIDAVYISKDGTVLAIETIKPWRIGSLVKHTKDVLELKEGVAAKLLKVGDKISIRSK